MQSIIVDSILAARYYLFKSKKPYEYDLAGYAIHKYILSPNCPKAQTLDSFCLNLHLYPLGIGSLSMIKSKHFAVSTYSEIRYGFLLSDAKRFDRSISLNGRLGFFDASANALISSLKRMLNDGPADNYQQHIDDLQKKHPFTPIERLVTVIPIPFNRYHKEMLQNMKLFLDDDRTNPIDGRSGMFQIAPRFQTILAALRGAVAEEMSLVKSESPSNDTLDSLMLACHYFRYVPLGGNRK
jgi:hypothetical protein